MSIAIHSKIFILLFVLSFLRVNAQEKEPPAVPNLADKDFMLDVQFFPEDNNFAKSGVPIKDGFILAGQKFNQGDSILTPSAIVKLSEDGKVLQQQFLGNNHPLKRGRMEFVFKVDEERILLIGEKAKKMWLRLVDKDLNVLRDTVFDSFEFTFSWPPRAFVQDGNIIIVSNSNEENSVFNLSLIDLHWRKIEHFTYTNSDKKLGYLSYTFYDAEIDLENNKLYLLGKGCLEIGDLKCEKDENSIIAYDLHSRGVSGVFPLKEVAVKALEIHNHSFYIAGSSHREIKKKMVNGYGFTKDFDFVVSKYDFNGEKKMEFRFDEYRSEILYDMKIFKDKIHLVGEIFKDEEIRFESAYLQFDLFGNLLEKRIFGAPNSRENRILSLYELPNDKILLLGKGKGWRVIIK